MTAFVTGFANQANENIERQKLEDRENDLIWANKFEKGKAEYEKERKEASEKAKYYNTLVDTFQGNKKAADLAFQLSKQNPKGAMQAISWVNENASAGRLPDNGTTNDPLADIQNNLSTRYQNLEELKGSARQGSLFRSGNSFAQNMQMPTSPGSNYTGGQQQAAQPSSPSYAPTTRQPTSVPASRPTNDTAGDLPAAGPPISLDGPAQGLQKPMSEEQYRAQNPQGTFKASADTVTPSNGNSSLPNITSTQTTSDRGLIPFRTPESMAQQKLAEHREKELQFQYARLKWEMARKPDSPEVAANLTAGNKVAIDFFNDNKTGVEANHQSLIAAQPLRYEVEGMLEMLNKGFLAKSGQEVLDSVNKITAPYLGLDLSTMSWANQIKDANLMRKYVANALIDRLKTMHFGRITNYTEQLTLKGMPGVDNDPDTNVRIVLALQDTLKSALEVNQLVQKTVYSRENQEALRKPYSEGGKTWVDLMFDAKLVAKEYNDKYLQKREPYPMVTDLKQITNLEQGTWFENKKDHKMYRYMGIENGAIKLQDAGSAQHGLPHFYTVPLGQ
jgi:hypothetical protein